MNKQEALDNILTRREAEQFLGMTNNALQYHLKKGNVAPSKTVGEGRGSVQLFWKPDLRIFKGRNDMINFTVSHSYEEDYFHIDEINVVISDKQEKERIQKAIEERSLAGYIGYPSRENFAKLLGVSESKIDIDIHEIEV